MPRKRDLYYLWQATEEFPLLAIDTNGDGQITDGTELFGEWTFGGRIASTLSFSIATEGRSATSSAVLQGDGVLIGKSTQTLSTGEKVTYSWKAEQVL